MSDDKPREGDDEDRWWRLDFTMVMMLLVFGAILLILTFELWHTHFGSH